MHTSIISRQQHRPKPLCGASIRPQPTPRTPNDVFCIASAIMVHELRAAPSGGFACLPGSVFVMQREAEWCNGCPPST